MKIAGFLKNSFVDYPGKIASVLFVPGCNMDCYYCHNKHLLDPEVEEIDQDDVYSFLKTRVGFIDAVVISGGEPTIHPDIIRMIKEIKDMGYLIKLDSNGFEPDQIEILMSKELLSYVAIDIKAPFEKYSLISNKKCDTNKLKKTIQILIDSEIEYEFRTTFVPDLYREDLLQISKEIIGAKNYYIQQFRSQTKSNGIIDLRAIKKPHSKEYIFDCIENIKKVLTTTNVRPRGVK